MSSQVNDAGALHGLRQLSEAEMVARMLRQTALELNQQADALEIAYGSQEDPKRIVEFRFDPRKLKPKKKK